MDTFKYKMAQKSVVTIFFNSLLLTIWDYLYCLVLFRNVYFSRPSLLEPQKAEIVGLTIVYLHNILRKSRTSRNIYNLPGSFDIEENGKLIEESWRENEQPLQHLVKIYVCMFIWTWTLQNSMSLVHKKTKIG